MKLTKILVLLVAAAMSVGCYEKYDDVSPAVVYDDGVFASQFPDSRRVTVAELKAMFGTISNTGVNSSWANTKYLQIEQDIYIKGKVTSDDEQGNIYKSLYVQDHTGGIEVKLTNGNYLRYRQGQWGIRASARPLSGQLPHDALYRRRADRVVQQGGRA